MNNLISSGCAYRKIGRSYGTLVFEVLQTQIKIRGNKIGHTYSIFLEFISIS